MDIFDDPLNYEKGRVKMFLEAKNLVDEQYPAARDEAKMQLIGQLVEAHAVLLAGKQIAAEISGSVFDLANAVREVGDE
ncbi:hypothetical protein GCM10010873_17880 [Cypionkella aquatica]|uniref:Uncharacterized protein n=1 Tax=Cypionkella aquatica TaxID=1756042 RepID=A0AA37U3F7_9RHOB|nr:hypothetical protein [Cypionkella aquatica]GLS86814.1 hypothetical protein GCM10010873_17880 [Cypionkella aquatica]